MAGRAEKDCRPVSRFKTGSQATRELAHAHKKESRKVSENTLDGRLSLGHPAGVSGIS